MKTRVPSLLVAGEPESKTIKPYVHIGAMSVWLEFHLDGEKLCLNPFNLFDSLWPKVALYGSLCREPFPEWSWIVSRDKFDNTKTKECNMFTSHVCLVEDVREKVPEVLAVAKVSWRFPQAMETYIAEGCEGVPRNTMCCITMHFNAFPGSRRLFKGRDLKPTKSTDAGPNSGWRWSDTSLCICLNYWLKVAVLSKTCHPKWKHVSLAFRLLISDLFAKCRRRNPRCHAAATESVTDTVRAPWCDFFNQNLWAIWFKSNKSCQDFGIFKSFQFISHLISQLNSSDLKSLWFLTLELCSGGVVFGCDLAPRWDERIRSVAALFFRHLRRWPKPFLHTGPVSNA